MSTAATQLLEAFDRLPPEERREFSAVIVHRAAQLDDGDISDQGLTASAARMFAMLDEEAARLALAEAAYFRNVAVHERPGT